ncbi:toll/interleukin-1 receptor domain-containing protein [Deinococcus gobiensis]|nr:toll/interleukin-1 receptor domain-containing protein [Deinococcus gobiensis]
MKIFLSWSGDLSREVAEAFEEWIRCVIQTSDPWVSSHNIESGSVWFREINDQLKDVSVGVIFLTKENLDKRWILFEAGALAKGLSTNRVCTFLINLEPADISDPLAQFNHTWIEKTSVAKLVATINRSTASPVPNQVVSSVFEVYWPLLENKIAEIIKKYPTNKDTQAQTKEELDLEMLTGIRNINNRLARLEAYNDTINNSAASVMPALELTKLDGDSVALARRRQARQRILDAEVLSMVNAATTERVNSKQELFKLLATMGIDENSYERLANRYFQ